MLIESRTHWSTVPAKTEPSASLKPLIVGILPELQAAELELPLSDEAMSVASWLHDEAAALDIEYGTETATVRMEAKPPLVAKARSRVVKH